VNSLKSILPRTLDHIGIRKLFNQQLIITHWRKIVGEDLFAHARAVSVNRGVVLVAVDSSVWCHHLMISKRDIIQKLNEYTGEKVIIDIRFKAGYLQDYQNEENSMGEIGFNEKLRLIRLTEEEKQNAEAMVSVIKSQALKRKILKLIKKDIALRKLKVDEHWQTCRHCSTLCPPGETQCISCSLTQKKERRDRIRKILLEVPWLDFRHFREFVECKEEEYWLCKRDLMAQLEFDVRKNPENNLQLITYIMLRQAIKPEQVTEDIVNHTLNSLRRKKYVFTPGG
jgi:hypothetical protein